LRRPIVFGSLSKLPTLTGSKVRLRPKRLQDAANDYGWRRDAELCRLDAAIPILCSFEEFLENYVEELHHPSLSYRFAIETLDGKHIGNCSYFNIEETESEMGIMIGDRAYWNQGYGADAILTSLNHIFSQTKLKRIHLKTLTWNFRAQKCFQKCSFVPCGQLIRGDHTFIIMEIRRPAGPQRQTKLERSLNNGTESKG
jgi:RimJ/RimL family protein N-acetyltransferase